MAAQIARNFFTVLDFLSLFKKDELNLKPSFQRNYVWKTAARSLLLDTVLQDLPMPLILLRNEATGTDAKYSVVDGQQRLTSLLAFILPDRFSEEMRFELAPAHRKKYQSINFSGLTEEQQDRILQYQLSVYILPRSTNDGVVLDIFSRINTTGTKLNPQETRNAVFQGYFKQFVYRIASDNFAYWDKVKLFKNQDLLRMQDAELISDLTNYMLHGVRPRNQNELSQLYQKFDAIEFPFEDVATDRLGIVMSEILELLDGFPADSPFRTRTWFYALFCHSYHFCFAGAKLNNPAESKSLPIAWRELNDSLEDILHRRDDLRTARTTNLNSRKMRNAVLGDLIYGDDWSSRNTL